MSMQRPAHAKTLDASDIVFETAVTSEEIAAVSAVIVAAAAEQAAAAELAPSPASNGWVRSARPIRQELVPGPGAWRHGV
ncbi:acyl-CoA carboxylase epsilon subunit [Microbacterium sp. STN6]|uniref:acyl-CoA carboxylase epsilon subunit n=1 Tax=Microbacterium sp. STN6 TaxID=2995588 RepID=UPI002260EEF8|nr:acyl-CoA carboxylase epsilon subunit [Microbacterium sp. STN6]MCX7520990.1 acyl-CoA carboxylase epsilon subunit [Microbacterium sp. STN6]